MKIIGRTICEDGREKGFIEVFRTKQGNRYIAMRDDDNMIAVPFECLICFCEQFPASPIISKEDAGRALKAIEEYLSNN